MADEKKDKHRAKTNRKHIPTKTRYKVWEKRNGVVVGKCYVCNDELLFSNFECGHIESDKNGGSNDIDNLEPICASCNKGMGTGNLNIYKKQFLTNKHLIFSKSIDKIKEEVLKKTILLSTFDPLGTIKEKVCTAISNSEKLLHIWAIIYDSGGTLNISNGKRIGTVCCRYINSEIIICDEYESAFV